MASIWEKRREGCKKQIVGLLELNSQNDWTWFIKGMALNGLKNYKEALECSDKALALDANSAWTLANKAWALNGLKKYEEALACKNKALALNQNDIPTFCMLQNIFFHNDNFYLLKRLLNMNS